MESNWRFNVWNYGWSQSGFRLIARDRLRADRIYGYEWDEENTKIVTTLALVPGQFWIPVRYDFYTREYSPFRFYDVLPDNVQM